MVENLFKDKHNCAECPFVLLYKGKIPFGCGDYHRMYCKLKYGFYYDVNFIMGSVYNIIQLASILEKVKKVNPVESVNNTVPDIIKAHPNNNEIYIVSVLRVKELDACPIDLEKNGVATLSEEHKKQYNEWLVRYGNGVTIQDKALMNEEKKRIIKKIKK
jgi:hypothetical protein